ncbi:MAG: AAA family ATPase [Gemmatimonadota bacterium]|nr:AAA family ATPase [Gemmatimonadota bacterium]
MTGPSTPLSEPSVFSTQKRPQPLRLDFFGGPALWRDGESVRISPFQAGLLAIAFGTGRTLIPRSKVQRLLWGNDQGRAVRHRLSQLVYQTNHRCRTRIIALEGEYMRVNTRAVATDLQEFDTLIRLSDFRAALGLLERGFLSAFPSRKTDALADWIEKLEIGKRARLRSKALAAWGASAASNDWLNARDSAQVLFRLDPHDEVTLRQVLRAQATGGMVREAEALYRSLGEHADTSSRGRPESGARDLLKMVRILGRFPGRKPGIAEEGAGLPLAGRASELAHIGASIFRSNSRNPWHTITVSGEAGLGKTRLVEEAIRSADLRGYHVMRACPGDLERDIPLSPLLEALNQPWVAPILESLADPWRSHLLSLLPQFGHLVKFRSETPDAHTGTPDVTRHLTCEALLRLFTAIAESRPVLVFLDDFHSTDEASVTVVQFLKRRWRRGDLTLLACYRQEELARNQLAGRLIAEMEAKAGSTPIRLGELTESSARELVASLGAEELDEPRVDRIVRLAGGNPLFLIELAADAVAGGDRRQTDADVRVPHAVRAIIARRMGELGSDARNLLAGLAVFGQPADLRQLSRITGRGRHECIDSLESLLRRRFVAPNGDKVTIRQGLVRHAVYQGLSQARRSLLHGLAAEAFRSATAGSRPDLVALHYHRAGNRELSYIYALEAARPETRCPPADRLRLLEIAYEAGEGARRDRVVPPLARAHHRARRLKAARRYGNEALTRGAGLSRSEHVEMRLIVADADYLLGRRPLAATLARLAELEAVVREKGDDAALAAVVDTNLLVLHRAGNRNDVVRLLDTLEGTHGFRDPRANCRILAAGALVAAYGDPATGLERALKSVDIARESQLHDEVLSALQRYVATLATAGLLATDRGRTAVALARSEARRSDDISSYVVILLALAEWHTATGNPEIASGILEEARSMTAPMDCPEIRALEHLARGNLALARSDLPTAMSALQGAAGGDSASPTALGEGRGEPADPHDGPVRRGSPPPPNLSGALASLQGSLCLESGKFGQAVEVAGNHPVAEPLADTAPELVLFHARLLSRRGDNTAALALLEHAAEAYGADRPVHWLRLTLDLVRLARRSGNARPELAALARDRARELNLPDLAHEFVPFAR